MKESTTVIGRLCLELYPETGSELKAVERYILKLQEIIDFKRRFEIDAADDIEFHDYLQMHREIIINSTGKERIV
ncbi:MAG: hypothetical protein Kow0098_03270 [Ignavibacteriaceae bacterium]